MRRTSFGLIAALFFWLAFGAQAESLLKSEENVEDGALTDTGLWFKLDWGDQTFVVDRAKAPDAETMFKALKDAAREGRSVAVWYDPDTAAIDRQKWLPTFVVRKLVAGGQTIAGDETVPSRTPAASPVEAAERALAQGIAYSVAGQSKAAQPLLDRALAEAGLAAPLKVLGLKARAQLREDAALADFPPGDARDRALIAALDDARAWRKAAPEEPRAAFQVARVLEFLGAYDDAIAIYKDGLLRWPRESDRVYRGLEWAYRDMGKLREASEWLDKLGALPGMKDSMPYRFHRGWLFDLMELPEAAIAEYTEGMKVQPDYQGAFWRRACSHAAAGHIKEAYDDFRTATKLRDGFMQGIAPTASTAFDAKRFAEVEEILRKTLAEDPARRVSGLCDGYWNWGDGARERSRLLR